MCYSAMVEKDLELIGETLDWQFLESSSLNQELPTRIYPGDQAAVIGLNEKGATIKAMTYGAHGPSWMDDKTIKKLTTYNSRRDSLQKPFWSESVGIQHGIVLLKGFFEWVAVTDLLNSGTIPFSEIELHLKTLAEQRKARLEGQGKKWQPTRTEKTPIEKRKVIIQIHPSEVFWTPVLISKRDESYAFAIITDEPSHRLNSAGHDRQPISIAREDLKSWLRPQNASAEDWQKWLKRTPSEELEITLAS